MLLHLTFSLSLLAATIVSLPTDIVTAILPHSQFEWAKEYFEQTNDLFIEAAQ